MFIDSHLHLYAREFDADREAVIQRMTEVGVYRAILPDIDQDTRQSLLNLADTYPDRFFPTLGVHPTSVTPEWRTEMRIVEQELSKRSIYAVGECGIDLYWDTTYRHEQIKAFEHHLGLAADCQLPVIIHAREALPDIFRSLAKFPQVQGVFHCFSGTLEEARRAIGEGFLLGIGGVVTYKKSNLPDIISTVGIHSILLETDAPYLAPVPHRGKRNESAYIPLIADKIAEITNLSVTDIAQITTLNCEKCFGLSSQTDSL